MKVRVVLALKCAFFLACNDDSSYAQGPLQLGTSADPTFAVVMRAEHESAVGLLDGSGSAIRDAYVRSHDAVDGPEIQDSVAIPSNPELEGVLTIINGRPAENLL